MNSFFSWLKELFANNKTIEPKPVAEEVPTELADAREVKRQTKINNIEAKKTEETKEDDFVIKLRKDLERDEGIVFEIYLDHLGYPTFGIGHLVREDDPEHGQPVGTPVSKERCYEAFEVDIRVSLEDCRRIFNNWKALPEEVRLITANMAFNLGYNRLNKFKNFRAAVDAGNWMKAADEMVDSRWYRQVTKRAQRLVERMKKV